MPIYMDLHILPGVKARDVAEAHRRDMLIQDEHSCNCMTYWIDEKRGNVFCLIEAPNQEAVIEMHNKSHGLVPSKVIEVSSGLVESFLGRINDPEVEPADDGLKIFSEPSFRFLLVTTMADPVLLQQSLGRELASQLIHRHNAVIREQLLAHEGSEVEGEGRGFIISFTSAAKAVACGLAIQQAFNDGGAILPGFKMGIHAGEPVSNNGRLFGDTLQLAARLCAVSSERTLAISSTVKDLLAKENLQDQPIVYLSEADEIWLSNLYNQLEAHWPDDEFAVPDYCQAMAMSQSQFYRKTLQLTGSSPGDLLKDYRLERARELLKKQGYPVSQVSFDAGFSSPSYFTKCFKKKYGLLPLAYKALL